MLSTSAAMSSQSSSGSSVMQTPSTIQSQQHELSLPKAWLTAFIQRTCNLHLSSLLSSTDKKKIFEELSGALESVLIPLEQHRNDFAYLETWCIYLELHFDLYQDEEEVRRLWKYLKSTHCGILHVLFYLQFAAFEMRAGHPERAQIVLAGGIEALHDNEQLKSARIGVIDTQSYFKLILERHSPQVCTPAAAGSQESIFLRPNSLRRLGLGPPKRVNLREDDSAIVPHHPTSTSSSSVDNRLNETLGTRNIDETTNKGLPIIHNENENTQSDEKTKSRSIKINGKQYRVLSIVGKGGSSRVFKVISNDGQLLALKRVSLKNLDDFTFNSYLNEIDLLQKFTDSASPNIIKLIDSEVNRQSGHLLILMEFGEIDLSRILKEQKSDEGHSIPFYFTQMVRAVQSVHSAKIVHCDLKPANFLLVQGKLKLIDFGISKAILNDTTNIVRENQVGTVNYMSPEALSDLNEGSVGSQSKLKIGRASDIWSLGCILYEMAHGAPPFAGFPSLVQRLKHIMDAGYQVPIPNTNSVYLDDLIKKCLTRNPKDRPSLDEMLEHPFLCPSPRAVCVTREQIQELLLKFRAAQPSLGSLDAEKVAGMIYDEWAK